MGREIRRVPKGWEHPTYTEGHDEGEYKPLYDNDFETELQEWLAGKKSWEDGTHKDLVNHPELSKNYKFWEYCGGPPNPKSYRPKFDVEPTCYQIYENVSEGTPVSPVFDSLDEIKTWLIEQGHSEHSAIMFVRDGYAPSMIMSGGKIFGPGISSLDGIQP